MTLIQILAQATTIDAAALASVSAFISSVGFPVALACFGAYVLWRFLSQIGKGTLEFMAGLTSSLNKGALDHAELRGAIDTHHENLKAKIDASSGEIKMHLDSVRGDILGAVDSMGDRVLDTALRPIVDHALANSTRTPPTGTHLRIEKPAPRSKAEVPEAEDTVVSDK